MHLHSACPNTWRAEPRKKNTLSFSRKNPPPPNQKCKEYFFFRGCRRVREAERSAYAFPTLLLCRSSVRSTEARSARGTLFHSSRIFDKVGSSSVIKILQFCFCPKNLLDAKIVSRPGVVIGSRTPLKMVGRKACGFDSHPGHKYI